MDDLQAWIGRTTEAEDIATPRLVEGFRATLSPHLAATEGGATPPGFHWCLAPDIAGMDALGPDGHPARGAFLPPVPLPRRMWAGGALAFAGPLMPGAQVRRRSTVAAVEEKHGRSGPLVFVTLRHDLETDDGPVLTEEQTLVYRAAVEGPAAPVPAPPAPPPAPHRHAVDIDPVLLFRYSALTFNGHRIHYDHPYATGAEHYPGLVIHGPLQATLLLNLAATVGGRTPSHFSFRGTHPATGPQRLTLAAAPGPDGGLSLAVLAADGHVTMRAEARWPDGLTPP